MKIKMKLESSHKIKMEVIIVPNNLGKGPMSTTEAQRNDHVVVAWPMVNGSCYALSLKMPHHNLV